ncbi:MAG TPA: hypothetical protein VNM41_08080 [Solirubrobacterales bacterium]|nr:hypothetical protein [Solirubrobacterales bacterium]
MTFGLWAIALPIPLLRPFLEAARAIPPAAPASAAPPATSGTFALLAALPTVLPAFLALPPTSPTAFRTASTFECLLEDPFEWEALLPLLELRGLLRDLALAFGFAAFDFGFTADFDFDAGFEVDDFFGFDFGVDLVFV